MLTVVALKMSSSNFLIVGSERETHGLSGMEICNGKYMVGECNGEMYHSLL